VCQPGECATWDNTGVKGNALSKFPRDILSTIPLFLGFLPTTQVTVSTACDVFRPSMHITHNTRTYPSSSSAEGRRRLARFACCTARSQSRRKLLKSAWYCVIWYTECHAWRFRHTTGRPNTATVPSLSCLAAHSVAVSVTQFPWSGAARGYGVSLQARQPSSKPSRRVRIALLRSTGCEPCVQQPCALGIETVTKTRNDGHKGSA